MLLDDAKIFYLKELFKFYDVALGHKLCIIMIHKLQNYYYGNT